MATKIYVLEEHLKPTAPIYIVVGKNKRQRLDSIPHYRPLMKYTFTDENGKQKTIRFKMMANSIDLQEQIAAGIPANEKFTISEKNLLRFRNGVLVSSNPLAQEYLESTPEFNGFKGKHHLYKRPTYRLLDKGAEVKSANETFMKNLAAANKIASLNLKQAQDLLIKVYGTHYVPPKIGEEFTTEESALQACQNLLVEYMDKGGDKAVEEINQENFSYDEEIKVLVGRLVGEGKLSFIAVKDAVARKKNNDWIKVKEIPSSLADEEREAQFRNFLSTKEGSSLLADLKNMVKS